MGFELLSVYFSTCMQVYVCKWTIIFLIHSLIVHLIGQRISTYAYQMLGEGNGNPLQCSCLENPRDRGAGWAAMYGVAQSRTQLERLSSSRPYICKNNRKPLGQQQQMVKHLPANAGDPGSIPGSGRCPGEGIGYPLQYSCLENSEDKGTWQATVHGVSKSRTRLSE